MGRHETCPYGGGRWDAGREGGGGVIYCRGVESICRCAHKARRHLLKAGEW